VPYLWWPVSGHPLGVSPLRPSASTCFSTSMRPSRIHHSVGQSRSQCGLPNEVRESSRDGSWRTLVKGDEQRQAPTHVPKHRRKSYSRPQDRHGRKYFDANADANPSALCWTVTYSTSARTRKFPAMANDCGRGWTAIGELKTRLLSQGQLSSSSLRQPSGEPSAFDSLREVRVYRKRCSHGTRSRDTLLRRKDEHPRRKRQLHGRE
jgi:hypothetical protein